MRILIVEDEQKIATTLKRGLEQESYAVDTADTLESGMAAAITGKYDLAVLDRMLPGGKDGLEICAELRKEHIHTPVLMLTAKEQIRDRVAGLDAGADDYLVKPFAFEELLARIRALLRRPQENAGTVLTVGDLTLDPARAEVRRGGTIINLSTKEFGLLEYLMRNHGHVLSKSQIISHVWDYDADILPNTVEVYVGYLREKVDRPFNGPKYLKTVRGFGYKLTTD